MGPTGELLQPLGDLGADDAADAFAEQAAGLDAGGADILWLETMSALPEVEAGVRGARQVSDLPIVVTLSYLLLAVLLRQALNWLGPRFVFGQRRA